MRRFKLGRFGVLLAVVAVAGFAGVGSASADYGNTAVRQIEISANVPGNTGGGAWLWIELNSNGNALSGTGTYAGSDCARGGAASDKGDVTWVSDGTTIRISGVVFNGFGGLPVPVTVPWKTGHYAGTVQSDFPSLVFLPPGFSQTTVAP
jgi:hypothetical protein